MNLLAVDRDIQLILVLLFGPNTQQQKVRAHHCKSHLTNTTLCGSVKTFLKSYLIYRNRQQQNSHDNHPVSQKSPFIADSTLPGSSRNSYTYLLLLFYKTRWEEGKRSENKAVSLQEINPHSEAMILQLSRTYRKKKH